jgi:hypothetical protein
VIRVELTAAEFRVEEVGDEVLTRVLGSSLATAVLVNAGSSSLRMGWCQGGSAVIGGSSPTGARSRGGRKLPTFTDREEKRSVS